MKFKVFDIDPVPKPRQTSRSKWKKTPSDERYYRFKDDVKEMNITVPESGYHVLFVLKMPKYWSLVKKNKMRHMSHKQKPDLDNMEKALFDACFKEDSHIWDCRCSKIWGDTGKIILITGIQTDWIKPFLEEVFDA